MKKELPVVIDLFCGAGGLSEGFKQAGFKSILGIDVDKSALETFALNHAGAETICGDISQITREQIAKKINRDTVDLIIGGPPCQGFSLAGRRNPNDPRNKLVQEFLRIVREFKPKFFVIENVQGFKSMRDKSGKLVIEIVKELAKESGYSVKPYLLNSKDYSVAQKRRRMFLIGSKKKNVEFDIKKTKEVVVGDLLFPQETIAEKYFYSQRLIDGFLRRAKRNKKLKRGFGWQFLKMNDQSYTISARYYKDGCEALVKYDDEFKAGSIRKLTERECARIQSFPDNYKFAGGKIKTYKQIGNAVPPNMAKAVAKSIKRILNS
ncbi:DNA cytosine methyltransferase [Candidatus Pacearchaeota archaeon]|nr:DNA cytosine methyltransferase [Candidatus Pacearchaeota archaeon]